MTIRSRSVFAGLVGIGGLVFAAGCNQADLDQAKKAAETAQQNEAGAKARAATLEAQVSDLRKQLADLKAAATTAPATPQAAAKPAAQPAAPAPTAAKPAKPAAGPAKPVADAVAPSPAPAAQPRDPQALAAELAQQEQKQREASSAEMQARLALDGLSEDADPTAVAAAQEKLRSAAEGRRTAAASVANLRAQKAAASPRGELVVE